MFICDLCGNTIPSGQNCHRVVTAWREVHYPARKGCNRPIYQWNPIKRRMEARPGSADDPGGIGKEAAKEAKACHGCAERHK